MGAMLADIDPIPTFPCFQGKGPVGEGRARKLELCDGMHNPNSHP